MNEWSFFVQIDGNQPWQVWVSLKGNTKMAESKMVQFKMAIQDGCHHQVKWKWMSLSQIELVWVRVRVEWECFWVNLKEDNKVSESKMAVSELPTWQNSRWLPSSSWVRMNEWNFFCGNGGNQPWQVWVNLNGNTRWLNPTWPNSRWQKSRWLSSSS